MRLFLDSYYATELGKYEIEIASSMSVTLIDGVIPSEENLAGEITRAITGFNIPDGRYYAMLDEFRFVIDIYDNMVNIVEPYRPEIRFEPDGIWVETVDADGNIFDNRVDKWRGFLISSYPIPGPEVWVPLCQAAERMFDNEEDMIDWIMDSIIKLNKK